ncbi:MAG: ABC transporter permease [Thermoleophilia bacterium]|nr:ABC transporter permease [Thermoleophilia bacterium]
MRGFSLRMAPMALFLLVCFVVPIAVLFAYSFGSSSTFGGLEFGTSLANYREVVSDYLFGDVYIRTIVLGVVIAVASLLIALPFAYAITLGPLRRQGDLMLFLVICSLFSAYIVRVYAWRTLLGRDGVINTGLSSLGLIDTPLDFLLYSKFALVIALVNVLVPFAVLPLYAAFSGIDRQIIEAAQTLGASPRRAFWTITMPLASRGIIAAFILCFVIAAGDYVTPQLVGGTNGQLVGNLVLARFGAAFDWPMGAALAFVLAAVVGIVIVAFVYILRALRIRDRPA